MAGLPDVFAPLVGPSHVLTDPSVLAGYEVDWTGRFRGQASAVVRPGHTDEVAAVLRACHERGVAVVPQGGNTGLVGGAVPHDGAIVLSLARLDHVAVDPSRSHVVAGAGATLAAVQSAARSAGREYAVDLGARDSATVGGTVATNAGGFRFLRHGGTRQQLVGLEAVLADGTVVARLRGLAKDNTGYDWPGLLCGSEGTLAAVTTAQCRLVAHPGARATALFGFASVEAAVEATIAARDACPTLDAAELMLAGGVDLVEEVVGLSAPLGGRPPAMVLFEAAGPDAVDALAGVARATEPAEVAVAGTVEQARLLWAVREAHTEAVNRLGPPHKLDVAVALDRLASFLAAVPAVVAAVAPGARTVLFGHAGDGNVHVNVAGADPNDERIDAAILEVVAEMGGSISAEHGIGRAKRPYLHLARSEAEISLFRSLKAALDPAGILNPGVLLPDP